MTRSNTNVSASGKAASTARKASDKANKTSTTTNTSADKVAAVGRYCGTDSVIYETAAASQPAPAPAPAAAVMPSAADVIIIAADLIRTHGTISALKTQYKTLTDKYTKEGYKAILSAAAGIRYKEIDTTAANVAAAVTYDGQLLAAYTDAASAADWRKLCGYVGLDPNTATSAATRADKIAAARAFVAAYFGNVDKDGQPLRRAWYVSPDGVTAYMTYIRKAATATSAAAVFLAAVNGVRKAGKAAAYYGKDGQQDGQRKAAHVRAVGHVYAVADIHTSTDGVISTTPATDKDGRKLTAAAIADKFAAVIVCDTDGTPATDKDGRRLFDTWADFRKAATADTDTASE